MTVPHGVDRSGAAGGTGAQGMVGSLSDLTDPNADRIIFWDDSAGDLDWLSLGTGLSISGTSLLLSSNLTTLTGLSVADGNFIVGNGTDWVVESGATARTSLGLVAGGAGDIWAEKAGDTFTGDVTISKAAPLLELNATGDTTNRIKFLRDGTAKWHIDREIATEDLVITDAASVLFRMARATGNVTFAGNVIPQALLDVSGASAGQIKFPATQNASADANTLDDYEKGTWTPSVGGTATYTTQTGSYTKIGRLVYVRLSLTINVLGTGSTQLITGAPFASATKTALAVDGGASLATAVVSFTSEINAGSTVTVEGRTAAAASSDTGSILGNATAIEVAGCYHV